MRASGALRGAFGALLAPGALAVVAACQRFERGDRLVDAWARIAAREGQAVR